MLKQLDKQALGRLILTKIRQADARKDWDESIRLLGLWNRLSRLQQYETPEIPGLDYREAA